MYYVIAVALGFLFKLTSTQDADCDFQQTVKVGTPLSVSPPAYPSNYSRGINCRWVATCPTGYNCRLDCTEINLPHTNGCKMDVLLISRTGDPQLIGADRYCGQRSLDGIVSTGQDMSVGLKVSESSPGGRFRCQLSAQIATKPPANCSCGYKKTNRIVGGVETGVNEYPMMAALFHQFSPIEHGAVIINERSVVTAAHCVYRRKTSDLRVLVGGHDLHNREEKRYVFSTSGILIHPNYNSNNYDYNVAIVNVKDTIQFSDRVGPVCLPFKFANSNFAGNYVTALGWGTLYAGGPTSKVLLKVDLQVITDESCRTTVSSLTARQMCTYTPRKDSCQGDSGGPILYTDPSTGLLFLAGIISTGKSCAVEDNPSINTRITAVLNWITANAPYNYCVK